MYWSPVMIRWIAESSASCPVTIGHGWTLAAFSAETAPLAVPSLAAYTPTIVVAVLRDLPGHPLLRLVGAPVRRVVLGEHAQPAASMTLWAPSREQRRVAVGGRAVDHQDAAVQVAARLERLDERGRLQLADLLVVERDVVGEVAAGDQPVVGDDRDALRRSPRPRS